MSGSTINYAFGLPLKNDFVEFVYYEKLILPHEIDKIRSFWEKDKTIRAEISSEERYKEDLRESSVMFLEPSPENDWLYRRLTDLVIQCNNQRYWFDLLGFFNELQMARYDEGHFFEWHMDFGRGSSSHRKLSITVQLSDPEEYEGGELQFMINQKVVSAPKTKGTVIIFPSFVMHRVTPVTKGTRESIVGWASGYPYR